jgi:squalene-associated FAD-dependent desaturase
VAERDNISESSRRVAVVGGGLAGLAAAHRLAQHGVPCELFEAKRMLGGRAGLFVDPQTGQQLDHCQHVLMGCCTQLRDFLASCGCERLFDRHTTIPFFAPDSRRCDLRAPRGLPAPMHLAPFLLRANYLSWRERWRIATALLSLAKHTVADGDPPMLTWLRDRRQSTRAIRYFWEVVLVSALGETLDRASTLAAKKVFVDGFLSSRDGYWLEYPRGSLSEVYDQIARHLETQGVLLHRGRPLQYLEHDKAGKLGLRLLDSDQPLHFDAYIVAVDWRQAARVLPERAFKEIAELDSWRTVGTSPITGAHLWFDRPIMDLPHAVLIGRLSQWVFQRPTADDSHYYQVVVSASRGLSAMGPDDALAEICGDLAATWPGAERAKLLRHHIVTQKDAVFSYHPELDALRPPQSTPLGNLALAGDWTRTEWPATMEGAVRSGNLAANAILDYLKLAPSPLAADLPRGRLAGWLIGTTPTADDRPAPGKRETSARPTSPTGDASTINVRRNQTQLPRPRD